MLGNQEALGDLELFQFGIAGKADHFHAILQRRRNGVQHVGRGDEEHLAQIVFDVEIVIHEHVILFWIEHFEQGRGRVATEVHRHLVDFVQHEDGIPGAGLLHHLKNLARQGANVCPAMAANLGLIAHAAEGKPDEFAPGSLRDRHAQRGLADARGTHKAQNRTFGVLHQPANGEKL